jgi:hypothetical protein
MSSLLHFAKTIGLLQDVVLKGRDFSRADQL